MKRGRGVGEGGGKSRMNENENEQSELEIKELGEGGYEGDMRVRLISFTIFGQGPALAGEINETELKGILPRPKSASRCEPWDFPGPAHETIPDSFNPLGPLDVSIRFSLRGLVAMAHCIYAPLSLSSTNLS